MNGQIGHFLKLSLDRMRDHAVPLAAALAVGLAVPITLVLRQDYLDWLALGPGGLPYNVGGWMVNLAMRAISKEMLSVAPYDDPRVIATCGPRATERFLRITLHPRRGPRPVVAAAAAPQRQYPIGMETKLEEMEDAGLRAIAANNADTLQVSTSVLERRGPAIFLQPHLAQTSWAGTRGEIAHFHQGSEGSAHVVLSAADAKEVMSKGWGQRHGLSGRAIPYTYLLIYAPRDEGELEIVLEIIKAGCRAMTNGMEIA